MFNNLGRQIVDSAITAMSRGVLKKKKKDLVRIMEREGENTPAYLMDVANRTREVGAFEKNKAGFSVAYSYKKATHYYVSSLPNVVAITGIKEANKLKFVNGLDDVFTIETTAGEVDIFAHFVNLSEDDVEDGEVAINGNKVVWSFNVFVKASTDNICPIHYPLFTAYIADNWHDVYFIANEFHPFTKAIGTRDAKFRFDNETYAVKAIVIGGKNSDLIASVFENLMDCVTVIYKETHITKGKKSEAELTSDLLADFINKTINGKLDESTKVKDSKERAISVAGTLKVEVEVEDKLVPLHRYLKEYAASVKHVSKGGHHASPIPHDRRGFFRRSRGRGDYELVNGEFVYVGNKEGSYSWVPATHVGEKKSNKKPTLIYKV